MEDKKVQLANPADMLEVVSDMPPPLAGLLFEFPSNGQQWSLDARKRWMIAFNAICDMLYPESIAIAEPAKAALPDVPTPEKPKRDKPDTYAKRRLQEIATATEVTEETTKRHTRTTALVSETGETFTFGPQPYENSKHGAQIVIDIIRQVGKPGHVWLNSAGRLKVCGPDYQPTDTDRHVGTYNTLSLVSKISEDLEEVWGEIKSEMSRTSETA